jgi:hypothetical protein
MANDRSAREAWVTRVLGVSVTAAAAGAAADAASGLVAYRRALLDYARAKSVVAAQIQALCRAIPADLPDEADLAGQLAEELEAINDDIGDSIDEAMNAAQSEREPYTVQTKRLLDRYIAELNSDKLVSHVDANPFVPVQIVATLSAALTEIRKLMV